MKIIGKILTIDRDEIIAESESFLDVKVGFFEEGQEEPREIRKYGFPTKTTKKQLVAELTKVVAEYNSSLGQADEQAKIDADMANTDQLKEDLEGAEIT